MKTFLSLLSLMAAITVTNGAVATPEFKSIEHQNTGLRLRWAGSLGGVETVEVLRFENNKNESIIQLPAKDLGTYFVASLNENGAWWEDTNVVNSALYTYQVRYVGEDGSKSPWSNSLSLSGVYQPKTLTLIPSRVQRMSLPHQVLPPLP